MTFEERTHYDAIRKFMRSKPIDRRPIYIFGNADLWHIIDIDSRTIVFGVTTYTIRCKNRQQEGRSIEITESELLPRIILDYEIPAKYPELLL